MEYRNHALEKVIEVVRDNPNKYTYSELAVLSNLTYDQVAAGVRRGKHRYTLIVRPDKKEKPTYTPKQRQQLIPNPPNTENVMVIGDLHEPFTLEGYREFCHETYKKYKITHVISIGDLIDNHYPSFHTPSPNGLGGGDELDLAIEHIKEWVKMFPKIDVILGNHDRIIMRQAFESRIPMQWMMQYQDVLGAPGWNFTPSATYDGIHYIHGEGGKAIARARKDLVSTVQGHWHSDAYTQYIVGEHFKVFGMQVGCGVDRHSYAMAYAKDHGKPAIGVGIILNHGELAFNVLMKL